MSNRIARLVMACIGTALCSQHRIATAEGNIVETPDNQQIEQAIALLEKENQRNQIRSETYRRFADSINNAFALGTAVNEIGIEEGHCFAIGMLVGLPEAVRHLRPTSEPNLTHRSDDTAFDARLEAQFLENFERAANEVINATPKQRAQMWNLDCSRKQDIESVYTSPASSSAFFSIEDEGKTLRILGNIESGFADKLIESIQRNPTVKTIALGSGGGVVAEAIRAGSYIRDRRLDTTLWNGCYSACPLVFLGGVNRIVWSPYPVIGFHQISIDGKAIPLNSPVYDLVSRYASRMGADPHYVLRMMHKAMPSDMNEIADDPELCDVGVATWVQRRCFK